MSAATDKILIAGIGNIFCRDDGFGCELAKRLAALDWPDGVDVIDFGIRGFDLALALLAEYDAALLLDAAARGGPAGTLYVIEPEAARQMEQPAQLDGHGMHPAVVLDLVEQLGGTRARVYVVCCEPESLGDPAVADVGLTEPVAAALEPAQAMVQDMVARLRAGQEVTGA